MSTDWLHLAACRGKDPELWFPENGDHATKAEAKAICNACPVKPECLAYARALGIRSGIWAGRTWTRDRSHRSTERKATRNQTIIQLAGQNVRAEDIADQLGITPRTVWRVLDAARQKEQVAA